MIKVHNLHGELKYFVSFSLNFDLFKFFRDNLGGCFILVRTWNVDHFRVTAL